MDIVGWGLARCREVFQPIENAHARTLTHAAAGCDTMTVMIESFVDLNYRGLALGRRVKLTQVRPSTGYLELPAPMPVGTSISIATDDGLSLDATITEVHEQVGGSDKPAGMLVRPKLDLDAAKAWWSERVALPELGKVQAAAPVGTVRPKRKSEGGVPELVDDGRNTAVMEAISEVPPEPLRDTAVNEIQVPPARDSSPQIAIQDDGKRTIAMDAVDLAALGLDAASSSGSMPVATDDDSDKSGARKKRKKR